MDKKGTYYFSHDYNARNDFKILYMRQELGMEGYGIYWYIIEALADSGGVLPLNIIPILAKQMDATLIKVEGVIMNYNLFQIVDNQFFSERLMKHLEYRNVLSENGKIGASIRWGDKGANGGANGGANALPNAKERKGKEIKGNESKEKEIKENEIKENESELTITDSNLFRKPNIPTFEKVKEKFLMSGGTEEMARGFFNKWEGVEWFSNNSPIRNWEAFANNYISSWLKNESNKNQKNNQTFDPTKVKIILK